MLRRNLLTDLVWGMYWGMALAVVLCCYVVTLYVLHGSQSFEMSHTTLGGVIFLYLVSGCLSGAVMGLLRPLTAKQWGAAIVGFVVAMPVFVLIRWSVEGFGWQSGDLFAMLGFSLTLGAPVGWAYHRMFRAT